MATETKFEIEKVLNVEYIGKVASRFLVRWKGYAKDDDSWIDSRCLDCSIEQFCDSHGINVVFPAWQPLVGEFVTTDTD